MDAIARFTISHARFSAFLVFAVLVAGAMTFTTLPRQEDPEVQNRAAQVVTLAPGLSPERVEQLITRPIEDAIKQLSEIDEINSTSVSGMSIVTPKVDARLSEVQTTWAKLRNKMEDLRTSLPEGIQGPQVNDDFGRVSVVTLALTGRDYSMAELFEVAKDIRDELGALELVARVDLHGAQDERIWLEFDSQSLSQFDLDPSQIIGTSIQAQNILLPGGSINAAGDRVAIEPSGDFKSVEAIRNLPVATDDAGGILYLRDVAEVTRSFVDPPEAPAYYNGQPAIVLGISMVEDANVVALGEEISWSVRSLRTALPLGMSLEVAIFQPGLVQESVNAATTNLLQTMAVVLVVVMLFLGWRTGLIVGAMVPLTVLLTLVGMSVGGIALHRVSIAAIIVALGLLVDNGVVVAEDIRRRLDGGADRLAAALGAPKTLAVPLLTSSLTTVLAFVPLMLVEDTTGEFLRSLGQVLAIALIGSWLLAISVTPALCFWFLPEEAGADSADAEQSGAVYRRYRELLGLMLRHRLLVVLAILGLLFSAGSVFQFVKQRSLGPSERGQFTVYVDLPAQADISQTIAATETLSSFLNDETRNPEVSNVLAYVGAGGPRFFLALSPNDPQPNKAFLVVTTKSPTQVPVMRLRTDEFILRELPEANGRSELLFLGDAAPGTVEIRAKGPDHDVLRTLGARVANVFHEIPGIHAVRSDWENAVLKLRVEVDQERARRAGVSSEEVASTLSAIFDGVKVTDYRERDKQIPVVIRAQSNDRDSLDRLNSVEIYSASLRGPVALLQIADIEGVVEPSKIKRTNQRRALTVAGYHPEKTAVELYEALRDSLAGIEVPRGYTLELEGEVKDSEESNQKLFAYAPHALFGVVLLLILQFNSFRRPAIILLTIPLILIGANFGLAAFGAYFDFAAMLGLFSLAGIIINNGIVLIDRVDQAREEGLEVDDAVVDAALARARPIIMTTITTVIGLVPLALFGGEFWFGMAIVIMCGLAVGTVLTLGVVPVFYSLFFRGQARSAVQ